ncbi:F-box family protein-like protein [Arabidopsis thaliana]|uniref:F-box protein At3g28330 n=1 Tax=Arabidopsis thaliana TaxID=3702 RepID=FB190_ARATH|nr:F-box family protein-like protein [Arabidopsis thaliana]Q9LHD3.2 RecName: Full=F-box protein At3g28330 [Arabidopsis thaliana]AEE77434.2 F-box family protein-like protein [Arabidopsis thaliana]|eukprot:NP_001319664.1 F-box family protein-like protein [Arabidopsis thaliana]
MERQKKKDMDFLTEDLWEIILARLPLKSIITTPKLVCKVWKSIIESRCFRDLFQSLHQNSHHSSWSLMCRGCETEIMSHYGSDNWNLNHSLGYYISSFLTDKFENYNEARVVSYTDVGLILVHRVSSQSFYVANPVSRQCVEILPSQKLDCFWILGIATRVENGVVLGYKVVLLKPNFTFLIYSSETGLWSLNSDTFPFSYISQEFNNPISLNGSLYWLAHGSEYQDFIVSIDFYVVDSRSDRCRATPFPDLDKVPKFRRTCTTSQGCLMYMNIFSIPKVDGNLEDKLCVWRLESWQWRLVFEISLDSIKTGFDYIPLGTDPFDAKTVYLWSRKCLLSINLHNGDIVLHKDVEHSSAGRILNSVDCPRDMTYILESNFASFVLPQWMHPFPSTVRSV